MISNSGHDENGKYRGGNAGDQTGTEWSIVPWYNRPWNYVLRFDDVNVRNLIAELAEEAAKNNNIGYDQNQRTTFWKALSKSGYRPKNITTKVEADCSSGVAAIVKAVGYLMNIQKLKNVSYDMYTGNERSVLKNAGAKVLNSATYLSSDRYLFRGDILLYEGHHTAINLTNGAAVVPTPSPTPNYYYKQIGWNKDNKGWWYAYGHNRGEYHVNNAWRINNKLYFFDTDGYCVKNPTITTDDDGALIQIKGDRVQ